jgi:hypothetical protein
MKKQLFLLFSVLLGYSEISFAYDPTRGALQNAPELRSYGYNQQDIYNKYHPSVNVGNSYNNNGNSYNNNGNSYNNTNPVIIHVPSKYGAIVLNNKTGIITDSVNEDSLEQAKRVAIQRCEKRGAGKFCKVRDWVRNGCHALATGTKNGLRFLSKGNSSTEGNSERLALENCSSRNYKECVIIVPERCSLPND